jgi:hypothetical protein
VSVKNKDKIFINTDLIRAKKIKFSINILPLFIGKINASLRLDEPFFELVKKNNIDNFTKLLIEEKTETRKKDLKGSVGQKEEESPLLEKPWLSRISINTVSVKNGNFTYLNYKSASDLRESYSLSQIDLEISDLGLDKDTLMVVKNSFDIKDGESKVHGPLAIELKLHHNTKEGAWLSSNFQGSVKLNNLELNLKNIFSKSKKDPMEMNFQGYVNSEKVSVEKLVFEIEALKAQALLDLNFKKVVKNLHLKLKADCPSLEKISFLFPSHKDLLKSGQFSLNINANIPLNETSKTSLSLSSKGLMNSSDFRVKSELESFFPLKGNLSFKSRFLDLNEILNPLKKEDDKSVSSTDSTQKKLQSKKTTSLEEPLFEALSKKLLNANFKTDFSITKITFDKNLIQKFLLNATLGSSTVELSNLSFLALGGKISSRSTMNLNQKELNGYLEASHVKLKELAEKFDKNLSKSFESEASIESSFKSPLKLNIDALSSKGKVTFHKGLIYTKYLLEYLQNSFKNYLHNLDSDKLLSKIEGELLNKKIFGNSVDKKKILTQALDKLVKNISALNPKFTSSSNYKISPTVVEYNIEHKILELKTTLKEEYVHMSPNIQVELGPRKELNGEIFCQTTEKFNKKLLEQNKDSELLFDNSKRIQFYLIISGTVSNPKISIDLKSLNESLFENFKKKQIERLKTKSKELIKDPKKLKNKVKDLFKGLFN